MKQIILIFLAFATINCTHETKKENASNPIDPIKKTTLEEPYVSHTYYLTDVDKRSPEYKAYEDTMNLFYEREETSFLPLYKFDKEIIAVHYYYDDSPELIDQLNRKILDLNFYDGEKIKEGSNISLVAKTDYGNFYKYSPATEKVLKAYTDSYTVLCTKGMVERKIEDLYFVYNDCYSLELFLVVRPIDEAIYGQPIVMTVSDDFDLREVEEREELENFYMRVDDFTNRRLDYVEPSKNFNLLGKHGEYYIGSNDDFNWQDRKKRKMFYPKRILFKKIKGVFKIVDVESLDLFGISCD